MDFLTGFSRRVPVILVELGCWRVCVDFWKEGLEHEVMVHPFNFSMDKKRVGKLICEE